MATDNDVIRYAAALGITVGEARRRVRLQEVAVGAVGVDEVTLLATLKRIKRKADIMEMDINSASKQGALQNIREVQLLVGIALRCVVGGDDA